MKQRFSILDFKAITNELNERLKNSFIQNFYSTQQRFLFIRFSNKDTLLIEPTARMHLVQSYDTEISHFCKKLREYCRHSRVHRIYQYGYDRIVIIDIQRYRIVIEFFSSGNVLILGENDMIIDLLRPIPNLKVIKGEKYIFNYIGLDLSFEKFKSTEWINFLPFEKEFVNIFENSIKKRFGKEIEELKNEEYRNELDKFFEEKRIEIETMGGYGEVILSKQKPDLLYSFKVMENITKENTLEIQNILNEIDSQRNQDQIEQQSNRQEEFKSSFSENTVVERFNDLDLNMNFNKSSDDITNTNDHKNNIQLIDREVLNNKIKERRNLKVLRFNSFNAASDYFFGDLGKSKKQDKEGKEIRIKKAQEKYIEELEVKANEHREVADILQENRKFISEILGIFKNVLQAKMEWSAFETFWESEKEKGNPYANAIISFDLCEKKCIVSIEDRCIELDLTIGLDKNIENYFLKKKKAVDKQKKTRSALDNIIDKLNSKKQVFKPQKRTVYWFEKFHFFISSEGFLIIGGKNAQQNDIIFKKHLDSNDLYFHSEIKGASSIICKAKPEYTFGESTIEEASYMSMCMSKCWTDGIVQPVFYVNPNQVSKNLPNGDVAPQGTFIITGKKNIVYPKRLEYGLGLLFKLTNSKDETDFCTNPTENDSILHAMPVCAPWCTVKNYKYKARLCPGDEKKSKIVSDIQSNFYKIAESSPEEYFVKIIGTEEYNSVILSKCKNAKII